MKWKDFRIGMRTTKTGLAIFVCILLFTILHRGNPMIACLSAAFSLRQDFSTTITFGKSRLLGNTIGGALAILYFLLMKCFHHHFLVEIFVLPLLVMICIAFSNGIKNNAGIIAGVAALLMISLNIPANETIGYALQRVLDTFIGVFVAMAMNITMRKNVAKEEASITRDLEELEREEEKLRVLRKNLELKQETKKNKESEVK